MGIEGMRLVEDEHLPSRIISSPLVVELVGLPDRAGIEHVGAGKCVLFRQFMVDFDREVILRGDLLTRKGKNPRIPCSQRRAVWQRVKAFTKLRTFGSTVICPEERLPTRASAEGTLSTCVVPKEERRPS